ncbi:MAG: hypothetical protein R3Y50_02350 [Rikenellaceae bacterium]
MKDRLQILKLIAKELKTSSISSEIFEKCYERNEWFDKENILDSLSAIVDGMFSEVELERFAAAYSDYGSEKNIGKSVAIIMAGNIPFVGVADLVYAIFSGFSNIYLKFASKDYFTMEWFVACVKKCCEGVVNIEQFDEQHIDKVIATGSDNSSRYFSHRYAEVDSLIRQNRSSVALISGSESENELQNLWSDIFLRYGQGCRNITQIFIPADYNIEKLVALWRKKVVENRHFLNVYLSHRAVMMMQKREFLDLGYAILVENSSLFAPLSQINYSRYSRVEEFEDFVMQNRERLQVVLKNPSEFGKAQFPSLFDFADGVDVIKFLFD